MTFCIYTYDRSGIVVSEIQPFAHFPTANGKEEGSSSVTTWSILVLTIRKRYNYTILTLSCNKEGKA